MDDCFGRFLHSLAMSHNFEYREEPQVLRALAVSHNCGYCEERKRRGNPRATGMAHVPTSGHKWLEV